MVPTGRSVHPHRRLQKHSPSTSLTQEIDPISDHWANENIHFDAIYTGYLGSFEQIDLVGKFFDRFGGDGTLVYTDPAMADNGVLYPGFTPEFAKKMGELCGKADVIVPNLTEAPSCWASTTWATTMTRPTQKAPQGPDRPGLQDRCADWRLLRAGQDRRHGL